jgi:hypothetical protein
MAFVTEMLEIFYLFVMTLCPALSYVSRKEGGASP